MPGTRRETLRENGAALPAPDGATNAEADQAAVACSPVRLRHVIDAVNRPTIIRDAPDGASGPEPPRDGFVPSSPDSVTFRLRAGGRLPTIHEPGCRPADGTDPKEALWIAKRS